MAANAIPNPNVTIEKKAVEHGEKKRSYDYCSRCSRCNNAHHRPDHQSGLFCFMCEELIELACDFIENLEADLWSRCWMARAVSA